jgi:hypothetical protein
VAVVIVAIGSMGSSSAVFAVVQFGFLDQFSFCFGVCDLALHSFGRQSEVFRFLGTGRVHAWLGEPCDAVHFKDLRARERTRERERERDQKHLFINILCSNTHSLSPSGAVASH